MTYLSALNPKAFLAAYKTGIEHVAKARTSITSAASAVLLPSALVILRRVKGTELEVLGKTIVIGSEIPP